MIKQAYKISAQLLIGCALLIAVSCDKYLDEHFDPSDNALNNGVWDEIKGNPDYSGFVTLAERVGLEAQITNNNSVTLWVPTNEAIAASGLANLSDDAVKRILQYHISVAPTFLNSLKDTVRAVTLLGKYITVVRKSGDGLYVNDSSKIVVENKSAKNGVIHQLGKVLFPKLSIAEFLEANKSQYSRFYNFINKYNRIKADLANSIKIGYNSKGQTIYDTVFISSNAFLNTIGDFYSEANVYTTNLVSDEVFNKALEDYVYPNLTNTTITPELETFLFERVIDSLIVNNTFKGEVNYTAGLNMLGRSKVDKVSMPYKIGPFTFYYLVDVNKSVAVNGDLLDKINTCSNGVVYSYKSIKIPKEWFSYPFGRAAYTFNASNVDSLSLLTKIYSTGRDSVFALDANNVYQKVSPTSSSIIYRERQRAWQYVIVKGLQSYIEYTVNVLPMRYNLIRECNSDYGSPVQASYQLIGNSGQVLVPSTNISTPFDNSVFLNNPPDNTGLTSMPAGYGRWIEQVSFPAAGTAKIRFTCTGNASSGNTGVNVDLIYLVPID